MFIYSSVFICGPDELREDAEKLLADDGFCPVNTNRLCLDPKKIFVKDIQDIDIFILGRCHAIYLCRGWQNDELSMFEFNTAVQNRMAVLMTKEEFQRTLSSFIVEQELRQFVPTIEILGDIYMPGFEKVGIYSRIVDPFDTPQSHEWYLVDFNTKILYNKRLNSMWGRKKSE